MPSPRASRGADHTYFQDEARFARRGPSHGFWALRGLLLCAVRQTGFTSSTCWRPSAVTGAMSAVIMPTLNTEVVNLSWSSSARVCPPG